MWFLIQKTNINKVNICSMKSLDKPKKIKRHPQRDLAAILFVEAGLAQKEIASELGVSENTIGKWCKEDHWQDQKQVQSGMAASIIKDLYKQINKVKEGAEANERSLNTQEADVIVKLSSAIDKMAKKKTPDMCMSVLVEFNEFLVSANQLEIAKSITGFQREFIQRMLRKS